MKNRPEGGVSDFVGNVSQTMNGLLTQTSPSRHPKNRGGAGGAGGVSVDVNKSRGAAGRSRGRGRGGGASGGSRLASAKPINSADLLPATPTAQPNGNTGPVDTDSADETDISRQQRFNKIDPGNQYEQVHPFPPRYRKSLLFNSSRSSAKPREK
jgi:hypothetical protein